MTNNPFKVLIVDDEPVVADTLTIIFGQHGYEVQRAYSAEEAIELLEDWTSDLAILDVILPNMNGIELAIMMKTRCPSCKLLLTSGQTRTSELLEDYKLKGHSFPILAKPTLPTEFLEMARHLLQSEELPNSLANDSLQSPMSTVPSRKAG